MCVWGWGWGWAWGCPGGGPVGPGASSSVSACSDLSQCGGLESSWRESRLFAEDAGIPAERTGEEGTARFTETAPQISTPNNETLNVQ